MDLNAYETIAEVRAGVRCSLYMPWEGVVRVRQLPTMKAVELHADDAVLSFETSRGATYVVDRPDDPWEDQPITTIWAPDPEPVATS